MIEVFRVENPDTRTGPFQTQDEFTQELAALAGKQNSLKVPWEDGLGLSWIPHGFVFGSPDLDALRRWFCLSNSIAKNTEIVRKLKERGFKLAEFLVPKDSYRMGHSGLQVAFDADHCRIEGLVAYRDLELLVS